MFASYGHWLKFNRASENIYVFSGAATPATACRTLVGIS